MMQAVRAQRLQLRRDVVGAAARAIDVFHAQQPAPAVGAGIEVTAKRCHQRTEMQRAAGGGGKAASVGDVIHDGFVPLPTGKCQLSLPGGSCLTAALYTTL